MKAEIIAIGSELTSGQNLDTNSRWLSLRLGELGIPVNFHTTVGDDRDACVAAVQTARTRAGLVLITGGLGPTQDDLTRDALAAAAGVTLIEDAKLLEQIRAMFAQRERPMPERNRVQAQLPAGAEPLINTVGTAPGIWMRLGETILAAMPGVPSEMTVMFTEQVVPRLRAIGLGESVTIEHKINCFGAGESQIEEKLLDLTRRDAMPEVGITVNDAVVSLRIRATATTQDAARQIIAPVAAVICERLGDWVFGTGEDDLHHAAFRMLAARKLTVATAESVTAGLVAHRLASISGASRHLLGGIVAYTNASKARDLNVPPALIDRHTAVSEPVAKAMAEGARARFGADFGVATTGYAGPDGEQIGLVYAALASADGTKVQRIIWGGTRAEVQSRAARLALNLLRLA